VTRCLELVADAVEELAAGDARANGLSRLGERGADEPFLIGDQVGVLRRRIADDERVGHVGPARARLVARPDVDLDREAGREGPAARLVLVALPHGCDDRVWRAYGAVLGARGAQLPANVVREERRAVEVQPAAGSRLGTGEQRTCGGHPGLGRPLRRADAVELQRRLRPPPQLDGGVVDRHADALRP
jgi:hypothetical protein